MTSTSQSSAFPHLGSTLFGAALALLIISIVDHFLGPAVSVRTLSQEQQVLADVHARLTNDYVEPVEPAAFSRSAVKGMIDSLNDPYSQFVGPEDITHLHEQSSGRMSGIGAFISPEHDIRWPREGGPAEQAGLLPGDHILSVNGEPSEDLSLDDLIRRIKGPPKTHVELVVRTQEGHQKTVKVLRADMPTRTIRHAQILDSSKGIGYIHIMAFAGSTETEFDAALDQLEANGLRSLVLDLRFNTGGRLSSAIAVAARFLDGGLICTLRNRNGGWIRRADPSDSRFLGMPVVILINEWSASGSEILAGSLRDRGAAVLVGSHSYGKGVYQEVHEYPEADFALKFTAGYYLTPGGRMLEGHRNPNLVGGLEPDLPVATTAEDTLSIRRWLATTLPPKKYYQRVQELYPDAIQDFPNDATLATALELMQQVL